MNKKEYWDSLGASIVFFILSTFFYFSNLNGGVISFSSKDNGGIYQFFIEPSLSLLSFIIGFLFFINFLINILKKLLN